MTRAASVLFAIALLLVPHPTAQQPRDNQRPASTGTAQVTGVVVADDEDGRPLRRTRVIISGSELDIARTAITSDEGVFSFDRLPAGRYSLTASKEGYVSVAFGASRPGRPGRTVTLAGNGTRHVQFRLPRGAVVTGMLRDPQGDPAPGVSVVILSRRFSPATAERRLRSVPNTTAVTDDRGVYRIYGLPAGAYVVTALPRLPGSAGGGEVIPVSREDVQRALAEVHDRRASARPGMPAPVRAASPAPDPRAGLAYAPTYFPGTTLENRATVIELAAGQVRTGVDFDLEYVSLATVEGFATMPPETRVQLTLTRADPGSPYQVTATARPAADGRFAFPRVQPGHYAIHARAFPSSVRTGATPAESSYWARTEIVVSGEGVDGVTLALEPALSLSGEVTFESQDTAAPVLENFRLPLRIGSSGGTASGPFPSALVHGDRVTLQGVVPGPYRLMSTPLGIRTRVGGWWLQSIRIDGREALDEALTVPPGSKHLKVKFSDRASELSGRVTDHAGAPLAEAFAVIFSDDPKSWFPHSRRVAAVRLNSEGRYVVWNLPPGDYLLAVSSDLDNNEWFDPETLESLRAGAVRLKLAENERKVLDIRQP